MASAPRTLLIDLRPSDAFVALHVAGSFNFPVPLLHVRRAELPPRTVALTLIVDPTLVPEPDMATAHAFFKRASWRISAVTTLAEYPSDELVSGPQSLGLRCWEPSQFLQDAFRQFLSPLHGGLAFDFGCGAGRDMAFLASNRWCVVGIDNRPPFLASSRGIHERFSGRDALGFTDGLCAHLRTHSPLRLEAADAVLMIRFLHRPLLVTMLLSIRSGGIFIASHFVDGVQNSVVGTPKSSDGFLFHNELEDTVAEVEKRFPRFRFEILHSEETTIDDGRPIVNFVARRISPS